jgi:hypothetical protein
MTVEGAVAIAAGIVAGSIAPSPRGDPRNAATHPPAHRLDRGALLPSRLRGMDPAEAPRLSLAMIRDPEAVELSVNTATVDDPGAPHARTHAPKH